jgi:hypothetical protein
MVFYELCDQDKRETVEYFKKNYGIETEQKE